MIAERLVRLKSSLQEKGNDYASILYHLAEEHYDSHVQLATSAEDARGLLSAEYERLANEQLSVSRAYVRALEIYLNVSIIEDE